MQSILLTFIHLSLSCSTHLPDHGEIIYVYNYVCQQLFFLHLAHCFSYTLPWKLFFFSFLKMVELYHRI